MKNRNMKMIISLILAVSMAVSLAGCGNSTGGGEPPGDGAGSGTVEGADEQSQDNALGEDGAVAMGRYVEEEIDLSEQLAGDGNRGIYRREDGSLVILNTVKGFMVSDDEGVTWTEEIPEWFSSMRNEGIYISDMKMTPDGTMGIVYNAANGAEEWNPVLKLVLTDGTEVLVETELTEEEGYFSGMAVSEDGRIFVATLSGSLYEVYMDGSTDKIMTAEENPQGFEVRDGLIFMDNDWGTGAMPMIYDMESEELVEDDVLKEFAQSDYPNRNYNGDIYRIMYLLPGEEQTVYLIGNKGIHRHVIGGNMMEQIVDGNLSMLSNPNYYVNSAIRLDGDIFLVLFANGKLLRFTYDPDIPAVPENTLKIYSLKEDENIRQAIASFQSEHADVFVSYEVGMTEGNPVTREDAVKRLNTELMAGTGPDLLVMDDLPLKSYVDKGLLLDLTDYLEEYDTREKLFHNIIDALKTDGRAYVVPATISLPMMIGESGSVSGIAKLSELADAVEALREENPGRDITGISSERGVMKRFVPVSAPVWTGEDGKIDRQTVGEFLEQCKRIHDAQMDGLDEDTIRELEEREEQEAAFYGIEADQMEWELTRNLFELLGGSVSMISGWVNAGHQWINAASIDRAEGFGNYDTVLMQGQISEVFRPNTMLAVTTTSGQPDTAREFMDLFLSGQVQSDYNGFPVNQGAFDIQFTPQEGYVAEDGGYNYIAVMSEDGQMISYTGYWPSDEQIADLKALLSQLRTAYVSDSVLEDAVFEQGVAYMQGGQTLEQALDEIDKKVSIYMAE